MTCSAHLATQATLLCCRLLHRQQISACSQLVCFVKQHHTSACGGVTQWHYNHQPPLQPGATLQARASQPQTSQPATRLLQLQPWPGTAWAVQAGTRHFCSGELRVIHAEMTEQQYHRLVDAALDHLQEKLEVFVEDMDIEGGDVEHAQGVLTVKLGSHGTFVINKQTPNRQIWLSSPVSGPFRYDLHDGKWVYSRDGRELYSQLEQELQQLLGSAPHLTE